MNILNWIERLCAASNPRAEIRTWPDGIATKVLADASTSAITPRGDLELLLRDRQIEDRARLPRP